MSHNDQHGTLSVKVAVAGTHMVVITDSFLIELKALPAGRKSCLVLGTEANFLRLVKSQLLEENSPTTVLLDQHHS